MGMRRLGCLMFHALQSVADGIWSELGGKVLMPLRGLRGMRGGSMLVVVLVEYGRYVVA